MARQVFPQMTKNEYQEYLARLARRLHTDAGYSLKDFQRDADNVEVLGFELGKFNLSDVDRQIIDKMFDSERVDNQGNLLLCGRYLDRSFVNVVANTLGSRCECDKGLNGFFSNRDKRCILEFCEGDMYLSLCESDEAYHRTYASHCEFSGIKMKDTCLQIFFDDVHVDDWYVPREDAEETRATVLKFGYAGYNDAAKEKYKQTPGSRPNPVVTVKVVDCRERVPLGTAIETATAKAARNNAIKNDVAREEKDYDLER